MRSSDGGEETGQDFKRVRNSVVGQYPIIGFLGTYPTYDAESRSENSFRMADDSPRVGNGAD